MLLRRNPLTTRKITSRPREKNSSRVRIILIRNDELHNIVYNKIRPK